MSELIEISIPEEKHFNNLVFPLTIGTTENVKVVENAVEFVSQNLNLIKEKLEKHGAILFRGFPIHEPKDFNDFAVAFGWENLPYIGFEKMI